LLQHGTNTRQPIIRTGSKLLNAQRSSKQFRILKCFLCFRIMRIICCSVVTLILCYSVVTRRGQHLSIRFPLDAACTFHIKLSAFYVHLILLFRTNFRCCCTGDHGPLLMNITRSNTNQEPMRHIILKYAKYGFWYR
jgi:hypothetical protein